MSLTTALLALSLAQASAAPAAPPEPASGAAAQPAAPAEVPAAQPGALATPAAEPALPEFGITFDAAFPQGVALAAVYRPLPFVRVWAGPAWNYAAFGLHGGAGVALARWAVTPVLSVEAGRYLATDLTPFLDGAGGIPDEMLPLLSDVRYAYGAAHLGVEFGSQRGFSFALRLGITRFSLRTTGTGEVTSTDGGETSTLRFTNPRFSGTAPSLKLGCTYWF